jgi:hypothetical protein
MTRFIPAPAPATPVIHWTCPAYDVIDGRRDRRGILSLRAGNELAMTTREDRRNTFMISSVASYALEYNECPVEAYNRAKERGHALHFIFALATVISDHRPARKSYIGVRIGEPVYFEGRYFLITAESNWNLGLKAVTEAEAEAAAAALAAGAAA